MRKIKLGDWEPPLPLQLLRLTPLTGDLWRVNAASIMIKDCDPVGFCALGENFLSVDAPPDGVDMLSYGARNYQVIVSVTLDQAKKFSGHYNGYMYRFGDHWVIKCLAPHMRRAYPGCEDKFYSENLTKEKKL